MGFYSGGLRCSFLEKDLVGWFDPIFTIETYKAAYSALVPISFGSRV